jgi:hypothetical protein
MSKYSPLGRYLLNLSPDVREIKLNFEKIEMIIDDRLPASASRYREWWANEEEGRHVQAHSWMNAGWSVDYVNLNARWVRFIRISR